MKPKHLLQWTALALALSTLNPQLSTCLAQGSLTPPGSPAPTMKTLAEIEARTPISSAPFTINVPGSYYLITNLTVSSGDAITIATSGVTLDLNGFTISSTANPAEGHGVRLNASLRNLAILNGHIQGGVTNNAGTYDGPGFMHGIYYSSAPPLNTRVAGVSVSGCLGSGIILGSGNSTVVESCMVRTVGGNGIQASLVKQSSAGDCGLGAISGVHVSDCLGETSGNSYGIIARIAQNCSASSSGGDGLHADTAQNCHASSGSGYGILATTAQNCYGYSGSGTGLYAQVTHDSYGNSTNGTGLFAFTAQNCKGYTTSGIGLYTSNAQNCYGYSSSGTGLYVYYTAIGCFGFSSSGPSALLARTANTCVGYRTGGRAIDATVANGCFASAGTNDINYKYNMP